LLLISSLLMKGEVVAKLRVYLLPVEAPGAQLVAE
jgi:hypothetical protein